jgi:multisubunit Na+/H+ antiporter MnhB subunit
MFGLVLLVIGLLYDSIGLNKRAINKFLYLADPRSWQLWMIPALWGIVLWFTIGWANYFGFIRKCRWLRPFVVLLTMLITLLFIIKFNYLICQEIVKWIYNNVYLNYIILPATNYMTMGVWSWRILVLPVVGIVTIIVALLIAKKYRRKKS